MKKYFLVPAEKYKQLSRTAQPQPEPPVDIEKASEKPPASSVDIAQPPPDWSSVEVPPPGLPANKRRYRDLTQTAPVKPRRADTSPWVKAWKNI